ncbi:baeRF3 domain-containing protein [Mycolicibacterium rhodesiae]|nr:hypothetical protein [Mycolicibacterium rhodesiae]
MRRKTSSSALIRQRGVGAIQTGSAMTDVPSTLRPNNCGASPDASVLGTTEGSHVIPVNANTVTLLQSMRADPSISILANTKPGARTGGQDIATLRFLAGRARQRLETEGCTDASALLAALGTMIDEAVSQPADLATAFFVNRAHSCWATLPVPVIDRCVIDPTFATRDLVRALHHTPRHNVLLLSSDQARLLHGHGATLAPSSAGAFPVHRRVADSNRGRTAVPTDAFLRRVDRALGTALRLNPAPLILAAAEPTASTFRRISRNTARLAGVVKGNHLTTPAAQLVELIRPVLGGYLKSRSKEALDHIERRARSGRVLRDIESAWLAARWERPEMLAVEEHYYYPARLDDTGDTLVPAQDVDHPDVIDDAVDELIEIVLRRGGWIALVEPGELPDNTHLALTLRRP